MSDTIWALFCFYAIGGWATVTVIIANVLREKDLRGDNLLGTVLVLLVIWAAWPVFLYDVLGEPKS